MTINDPQASEAFTSDGKLTIYALIFLGQLIEALRTAETQITELEARVAALEAA